jgi:hypothetical protein
MENIKENINEKSMVVKPSTSMNVEGVEVRFIDLETELLLDQKSNDLSTFMKDNTGVGLSDVELDVLYAKSQELLVDYRTYLSDVKFNFWLNRQQYNLLTDILLNKTEYDQNTVFIGIELTKTLGNIYDSVKKSAFKNDSELKVFKFDATELTYIFHLIKPHKVKGLKKEAFLFSEILISIANTSKILNYYDSLVKNLSGDIMKWASEFPISEIEGFVAQPLESGDMVESLN